MIKSSSKRYAVFTRIQNSPQQISSGYKDIQDAQYIYDWYCKNDPSAYIDTYSVQGEDIKELGMSPIFSILLGVLIILLFIALDIHLTGIMLLTCMIIGCLWVGLYKTRDGGIKPGKLKFKIQIQNSKFILQKLIRKIRKLIPAIFVDTPKGR